MGVRVADAVVGPGGWVAGVALAAAAVGEAAAAEGVGVGSASSSPQAANVRMAPGMAAPSSKVRSRFGNFTGGVYGRERDLTVKDERGRIEHVKCVERPPARWVLE